MCQISKGSRFEGLGLKGLSSQGLHLWRSRFGVGEPEEALSINSESCLAGCSGWVWVYPMEHLWLLSAAWFVDSG